MSNLKLVSVRLEKDVWAELVEQAWQERTTVSDLIRQAVEAKRGVKG